MSPRALSDRLRLLRTGRVDPGAEAGLTVVEVVIATFILLLGILASFQVFDAATRNTYRAEQSQVAQDRVQRELEELRDLDYDQVAMTAAPAASGSPNDPRARIAGTMFDLERNGGDDRQMVYNGSPLYAGGQVSEGVIDPGPEPFTSGDVSGQIYRFVVWQNEPGCVTVCPGTQDLKRVVVAVKLDDAAVSYANRPYTEQQSDFVDPNDSIISDLPAGGGNEITAEQFWLSDTACEADGTTARIVPLADHPLHNTLGVCADGLQNGTTPGSPDTLLLSSPPDTDPGDPGLPNPRDYSNDPYLEPVPNTDRGVQIVRQDTNGCAYTPVGTNPESKIHRWVTDPVPQAFAMNGKAVLEFATRTINDANHKGSLCVYLFSRQDSGPTAVDTPIINSATGNPYFLYTPPGSGFWPRNAWAQIRFQMDFSPLSLGVGRRLGVAISATDLTGGADAIQFLYEHHLFQTRLEVDTTTPLG